MWQNPQAASNVVDTNIRPLLDDIVSKALKSLNSSMPCPPPAAVLAELAPVKTAVLADDAADPKVVNTIEAFLEKISVPLPQLDIPMEKKCNGNFYGNRSLDVALSSLMASNVSIVDLSTSVVASQKTH